MSRTENKSYSDSDFNLFVEYNPFTQRETWFTDRFEVRFSMPMIEGPVQTDLPLDEYPVGDLSPVYDESFHEKLMRTVP